MVFSTAGSFVTRVEVSEDLALRLLNVPHIVLNVLLHRRALRVKMLSTLALAPHTNNLKASGRSLIIE